MTRHAAAAEIAGIATFDILQKWHTYLLNTLTQQPPTRFHTCCFQQQTRSCGWPYPTRWVPPCWVMRRNGSCSRRPLRCSCSLNLCAPSLSAPICRDLLKINRKSKGQGRNKQGELVEASVHEVLLASPVHLVHNPVSRPFPLMLWLAVGHSVSAVPLQSPFCRHHPFLSQVSQPPLSLSQPIRLLRQIGMPLCILTFPGPCLLPQEALPKAPEPAPVLCLAGVPLSTPPSQVAVSFLAHTPGTPAQVPLAMLSRGLCPPPDNASPASNMRKSGPLSVNAEGVGS